MLVGAGLALLFERKLIAISQKRLGISFLGRHGWAHLVSDVVKFWTKNAKRFSPLSYFGVLGSVGSLFLWSGLVTIFSLSANCASLDPWEFQLLFYIAYANITTLIVLGLLNSTRSKYSLIAAARTGSLNTLCELIFAATLFFLYARIGAVNFETANESAVWTLTALPLIALSFLIFTLFEARRAPFDHTEAESELVAGHLTEFGGRALLMLFLCEYVHVFACIFAIIVFVLGGVWAPMGLASLPFTPL